MRHITTIARAAGLERLIAEVLAEKWPHVAIVREKRNADEYETRGRAPSCHASIVLNIAAASTPLWPSKCRIFDAYCVSRAGIGQGPKRAKPEALDLDHELLLSAVSGHFSPIGIQAPRFDPRYNGRARVRKEAFLWVVPDAIC
jgi:hypothetical protein